MKMKHMLLILGLIFLCSCSNIYSHKQKWNNDQNIPNADIVFQTFVNKSTHETSMIEVLGFYSFSDNSISIVNTDKSLTTPLFMDSGTVVSLKKLGNLGLVQDFMGSIFIFTNQEYLDCDSQDSLGGDIHINNDQILINAVNQINVIDANNCLILSSILSSDDIQINEENPKISTFDISNDGTFLLLSLFSKKIIKVTLPNKDLNDYGVSGINPSISPDQKFFAYLGIDGIHIKTVIGDYDELIVPYNSTIPDSIDFNRRGIPPKPQWSKDGTEIVYHKCNLKNFIRCSDIKNYDIFVFNLETLEETKIISGGIYPSWNYYK